MSLRDRLLLAAARAYAEAYGFPPENAEERARWLAQRRLDPNDPQRDQVLKIELTYSDVLALAKAWERLQYWERQGPVALARWQQRFSQLIKLLKKARPALKLRGRRRAGGRLSAASRKQAYDKETERVRPFLDRAYSKMEEAGLRPTREGLRQKAEALTDSPELFELITETRVRAYLENKKAGG